MRNLSKYLILGFFVIVIISCNTLEKKVNRDPESRYVLVTPEIPVRLFFDENNSTLTTNQMAVLDTVVEFMLLKPNYYVIVTGFQDKTELPRTANYRADNIRDYIYKMGIPAGKINVNYRLESSIDLKLSEENKLNLYRAEVLLRKY